MTPAADLLAEAGLGTLVEPMRPAGAGRRNAVWFAETPRGSFVVRELADVQRLDMERSILERCATVGLPVAEVVWCRAEPTPAMIQRRLPGRRLADVGGGRDLLLDVVRVLRSVHAIAIESGAGNLTAELRGGNPALSSWFSDVVRDEARATDLSTEDETLVAAVLELFDAAGPFLDEQPVGLAHGDFQPENLLVDGTRVTGIVDWEAAKAGPPGLDLGWWDWWSDSFATPWSADEMIDAYAPDDRDAVDRMRQLVCLRVWAREVVAAARLGDEVRAVTSRAALGRQLRRSAPG